MNHLGELKEFLKDKRVSLFLDYDGTITPIVGRPENAEFPFFMRELLRSLSRCYPVAVISGRSLDDLKERINLDKIAYAGNHGLEIWSEDFQFEAGVENINLIETVNRIAEDITHSLANIKGVLVENKRLTASVHYRVADSRDTGLVINTVRKVLAPYIEKGAFVLSEGKKVIEIRPNIQWDKGKAVEWILEKIGFKNTLPIYAGDDVTDRDAFKVMRERGVSIQVGHQWEDVDYYFKIQAEVRFFLEWMKYLPYHKG